MRWYLALAALAFAMFFQTGGVAQAQATRTWVSGVGDDANPCSRTAPCKTFAGAISKTATGGEINIIDPGGFGAVTITKSISIVAEGATGGVLAAGTSGIIINSTTTQLRVHLEGLDIEGAGNGSVPGVSGVRVLGMGPIVTIKKCSIRNFGTAGVDVNANVGTRVMIENSVIEGNQIGVKVAGVSSGNTVYLTDSSVIASKNFGVQITSPSAVFMNRSTFAENVNGDFDHIGAAPRSISYGNNVIRNGTPTDQFPLK